MKQLCIGTAVLGAALIAAPVLGYAQLAVDIGKREYTLSCTICHGDSGKGDGPLVEYLKKPAADLTKIQKNNMGVFPFDRLYEVIDGREAIGPHGTREMPIFGRDYNQEAGEYFGFADPKGIESFVRGRIIALIGYIYTLQGK